MRFGPKFVGGSAVRPPDVDGCAMTCTGPITTTARTADSRTTSRRIAPPHAHFYNRDADVTRDSRATLPEAKRRSQATNRDRHEAPERVDETDLLDGPLARFQQHRAGDDDRHAHRARHGHVPGRAPLSLRHPAPGQDRE